MRKARARVKVSAGLRDVPWRETWNGARRAMRWLVTPEDMVRKYAQDAQVRGLETLLLQALDWPTNYVVPFFSALKTLAYQYNEMFPQWRFLVDLSVLAGYPKMKDREMSDDPFKWLTLKVDSAVDEVWWENAFYKETMKFAKAGQRVGPMLDLRSYVLSRWMWATNGATRYSGFYIDGELNKTKFGAAVSLSNSDLLKIVFGNEEGVFNYTDALGLYHNKVSVLDQRYNSDIGIFLKPDERGYKRRLIANVPLGQYILAAYFGYVESFFLPDNTSLYKSSPSLSDKLDVILRLRSRQFTAMPLDESAYDYHVTKVTWLGYIRYLRRIVFDSGAVELFSLYFNSANWTFEDERMRWEKGMPSGLALTSVLNSRVNYIKQAFLFPESYLNWASGDDAFLFFDKDKTPSLEDVAGLYKAWFGSDVNASKNWVSTIHAEFLKTVYTRGGTTGYPARVFSSLLYAGVERPFTPVERLQELAELWKQYYDRLGKQLDISVVSRDLSLAVSRMLPGFSKQVAVEWIHCPRASGGFGRLPWNNSRFKFDVGEVRNIPFYGSLISLPRRIEYVRSEMSFKREITKKNNININNNKIKMNERDTNNNTRDRFYFGPKPRLPPVVSMEGWERRLNMDDIPEWVPKKYKSEYLSTIPLPVIDLISTQNMSEVANQLGLWFVNHLGGSSAAVERRLNSSAFALSRHVLEWCGANEINTWC